MMYADPKRAVRSAASSSETVKVAVEVHQGLFFSFFILIMDTIIKDLRASFLCADDVVLCFET